MTTIHFGYLVLVGVFILSLNITPVCGESDDPSVQISYSSDCFMRDGGSLKNMWADGDLSYQKDEAIRFFGENTISRTTYFFIIGRYLPPAGARLTNPSVAVINNNSASFDMVSTNITDNYYCKWYYSWDLSDSGLEEGSYTIYAVSEPRDKDHLVTGKYSSLSIIIRAPSTPTPAKTVAPTDAPTTEAPALTTTVQTPWQTSPPVTTVQTAATANTTEQMLAQFTPWETPAPVEESPLSPEAACAALVIAAVAILWKRE